MRILKYPKWNLKPLLFAHLLAIFLVFSIFYTPLYSILWQRLDEGFFRFLKWTIADSSILQNFWAMANHRVADFIEDVFFLIFFLWLLKTTPQGEKLKKAAEFLFLALVTAAVILFINNLLFKQILLIKRYSPSMILEDLPRLSEQVCWLKVKDKSKLSFPSDHGTTALLFLANFLYLSKNRLLTITAFSYGIFLCLPRMVAGAHWLTDALFGSALIVLLIFSWIFCTPFASFCIEKIYRFFLLIRGLFKSSRKEKEPVR
jgi:membrane-associated phospholipid phosphatase